MLANELSKATVLDSAKRFKWFYYQDTIKSALRLFQQGLVYNINVYGERELSAAVQDKATYDVLLSLDEPETSLCECGGDSPCVHIWAVFFSVYSSFDSVPKLTQTWGKVLNKEPSKSKRTKQMSPSEERLEKLKAKRKKRKEQEQREKARNQQEAQAQRQKAQKRTNQNIKTKKLNQQADQLTKKDQKLADKLQEVLALHSDNTEDVPDHADQSMVDQIRTVTSLIEQTLPTQTDSALSQKPNLASGRMSSVHTAENSIPVAESSQSSQNHETSETLPSQSKVANWRRQFNKAYGSIRAEVPFGKLFDLSTRPFQRYFLSLEEFQPSSDEAVKELYKLHACVDVIFRIHSYKRAYSINYAHEIQLHAFLTHMTDLAYTMIQEVSELKGRQLEPLLAESIPIFDRLLFLGSWNLAERLELFKTFWTKLCDHREWIDTAYHHVEQELDKLVGSQEEEPERFAFTFALIHFHFLKEEDEQALQMIEASHLSFVQEALSWIQDLYREDKPDRLWLWLDFEVREIAAALKDTSSYASNYGGAISTILSIYREYSDQTRFQGAYVEAMKKFAPYSSRHYQTYLIEQKQYRAFVEMAIVRRHFPEDLYRSHIQEIQRRDAEALLPLYHQAVEAQIERKNRKSYKESMRYIRKLRTLYKSLNQEESWHTYVQRLSFHYKKLRALQQELKQRKFIP